jgi:hypothetical protein
MQWPAKQVLLLQRFARLHAEPLGFKGLEQVPVAGSQTPAT